MLSRYFIDKHIEDCVVVTDLGFAKRARAFAELVDAPLAIIEKRRVGNLDRAELMNVIGDVRGKRAIIVDDEIDTGGTLIEVVRALEREGVTEMWACATHGVMSDPAVERIRDSALSEVVITDSVPLAASKRIPKLTTLSVAPLIGEAIRRIHRGEIGRGPIQQRGLIHPGDAALGRERRWSHGRGRRGARRGRQGSADIVGDHSSDEPPSRATFAAGALSSGER
ncbi:MAG: ribose-phosphate diphosphokinase [Candidatus Limnocylindrales bacterium]